MTEHNLRAGTRPMVLLIGGPLDGEWEEDTGAPMIKILTKREPVVRVDDFTLPGAIASTLYHRKCFVFDRGELPYYSVHGLSPAGALLRLMTHYKPMKEPPVGKETAI